VWRSFTPLAPAEMAALRARISERARGGALEGYKTGINFDGTVKNSHWLTTASVAAQLAPRGTGAGCRNRAGWRGGGAYPAPCQECRPSLMP
jgi:hypothetical protein